MCSIHLGTERCTGNKEELIPKEALASFQMHVGWKILALTPLFHSASRGQCYASLYYEYYGVLLLLKVEFHA
jgi:hypothetical protein